MPPDQPLALPNAARAPPAGLVSVPLVRPASLGDGGLGDGGGAVPLRGLPSGAWAGRLAAGLGRSVWGGRSGAVGAADSVGAGCRVRAPEPMAATNQTSRFQTIRNAP